MEILTTTIIANNKLTHHFFQATSNGIHDLRGGVVPDDDVVSRVQLSIVEDKVALQGLCDLALSAIGGSQMVVLAVVDIPPLVYQCCQGHEEPRIIVATCHFLETIKKKKIKEIKVI